MSAFGQYTVIPQTGVTPHKGEQVYTCDPLPPVNAYSPQEAVRLALEKRESDWLAEGAVGATGTFRFAALFQSQRGFPAVCIVEADVEVAAVRVSDARLCGSGA